MRLGVALSLPLLLLAAPVAASEPRDSDTIVVTGTSMTRKEARTIAQAHARAVLGTPISGQNARWAEPVCIGAVGVRETTAVPVIDRIEAVARAAGARLAGPGCRPNVMLLFTRDADKGFAEIERRRPDLLSSTWAEDRKKLRVAGLPVRWFYGQVVEGLGGRQTGADAPALFGTAGALPDGLAVLNEGGASRIGSPAQVSVTGATVLIDVPRAAGVSLPALADYIAFAILSRTRIDAAPGTDSIMTLFRAEPDARPDGLSALDQAFLKALYSVPINRVASVHRGLMAEAMVNALETPAP